MSTSPFPVRRLLVDSRWKNVARRVLGWHLPVGTLGRPLFASLYRWHVFVRTSAAWSARFVWYEPLFRSQCTVVGEQFVMEQLPYLVGRGEIRIGDRVQFSGKPSFAFCSRYVDGPRLIIGDDCFLGHNTAITVAREVTIGNHCLIAGNVRISDFDGHPVNAMRRRGGQPADPEAVHPVRIGNDVWIGHSAMILKGVQVGDRSIIGARAVVTRDVPADSIVAGNPANVIRSLSIETRES